jgi:hypothetical protein
MKTKRTWRPEVEALEERTVLSAGLPLTPVALAPVAHHSLHTRHFLALDGSVSGTWQRRFTIPDTGGDQVLMGSGGIAPLGQVQVRGELHTPGFVLHGRTVGTVTLTNAKGSVTVRLIGPLQPGFSPPPSTFHYTLVGGTGRYAGASGSGRVAFQEQDTTFTLSFMTGRPVLGV